MAAPTSNWPTIGKLAGALLATGVLVAGVLLPYVGGLGLYAGQQANKFLNTPCTLQESRPPQRTTLLANDNKTVIATLFRQDRVPVSLKVIPKGLLDALVATEDRRFYEHHGVDMRGLMRGAVNTTGGDTQGGSTLTMQYVKQVRYYQANDDKAKQDAAIAQTLNRKIEDAKCAIYIERTLKESKDQILENYLNIAFFGENSYGIETAAGTYFNKHASQLTLNESALLVGLLRAPTDYDPFVHPEAAKERRNQVLDNLVKEGKLGVAEVVTLKAQPVSLATESPPVLRKGCANTPSKIPNVGFFCDYAVKWLQATGGLSSNLLETGGLRIVTTLDPRIQRTMQTNLHKQISARSPMTAVVPAVDPRNGNVLAMATSKRYGTEAGQTEQPIFTAYAAYAASTYKIFPLLAALSAGFPSDWTLDANGIDGTYAPKNCYGSDPKKPVRNADDSSRYGRNENLSEATAVSSNTFFVGLVDQGMNCDLQPSINIAVKLGMNNLRQPSDEDPKSTYGKFLADNQRAQQFVLGNVPTSPLELAGAYAGVANHGKFLAPTPILSITDGDGNALAVKSAPAVQAVAPDVAAEAITLLRGDTTAGGTAAGEFSGWYGAGHDAVAGKTGTVEAVDRHGDPNGLNASVWFVGATPQLTATAAIVNFDSTVTASRGLPGVGTGEAFGRYAASVWIRTLEPYLGQRAWSWPSSVPGSQVPDVSGLDLPTARQRLSDAGFQMQFLDPDVGQGLRCPSVNTFNTVAFYAPKIAIRGSAVTVCPSSGVSQPIYVPPPPPKTKPRRPGDRGSGNGSSSPARPNPTPTRNGGR